MLVGIVGLGLIGGSFAKAYAAEGHKVLALDKDEQIVQFAMLDGAVDGILTKDNIGECDLILVCVYPQAAIEFMNEFGESIGTKPVVIDCCGTKRTIVEKGMEIAKKYEFLYVGGHPMAGTQYSGFKYSRANLYHRAPMVIVPPRYDDMALLQKIKDILSPAGFGKITVAKADEHDEMIAYTSQLAHIVSNAYIKSPTARAHKGMSAGSYKDMTRVAWLNPQMWTELCMENREYLMKEMDILIDSLNEYQKALKENDSETLMRLFDEGRKIKKEADG